MYGMGSRSGLNGRNAQLRVASSSRGEQPFQDRVNVQLRQIDEWKRGVGLVEKQSEIRPRKNNRLHSLAPNQPLRQES
jgi:hypothetical protein